MLALAWQCLTGRYAASEFADRERAEWPPHPDRVFQALVASWGERGENEEERRALEWLERLGPPSIAAPEPEDRPIAVKTYVPPNDLEASERERLNGKYGDRLLGLLPQERKRKDRHFPYVRVGDAILALVWEDADAGEYREALSRIAAEVCRIGHSSSIVRCWIDDKVPSVMFRPAESMREGTIALRVPEPGRLGTLVETYRRGQDIGAYMPPPTARQIKYKPVVEPKLLVHGGFSDRLIVFEQTGGERFTLLQTLDLANAFRSTLIPFAESVGPVARSLVSGHESAGEALKGNHVAYIPLAFSGHQYADGHVLGMALALPSDLSVMEEDAVYATLAGAMGKDAEFNLTLGAKGIMRLELAADRLLPRSFRPETWARPSELWHTVTPIVLDRMAKKGMSHLSDWAAGEIAAACVRRGLPRPACVDVSPVPFLSGTFPCYRRPASRSKENRKKSGIAFPPLIKKDGCTNWMFHARIEFAEAVRGPLLLGAGRYKGYGFCMPESMPETRGNDADN